MRGDPPDESEMADEAFALSPISARAVLPSEQDYDAISEAFMETSRGRWFLGEYAKRNRNSDTRMVLDAVSRIEKTLAAQKQPAPKAGLNEALVSIRDAVEQAQAAAASAAESVAVEENLAPVRKAARIIREISWRWREIGADARICDLLDSQVGAIEGACGHISMPSPQEALSAAFDLIRARIAQFDDSDAAAAHAHTQAAAPTASSRPAADAVLTSTVETVQEISAPSNREPVNIPAEPAVATTVAAVVPVTEDATSEAADLATEAVVAMDEATGENVEAADAYDEALLDMVAHEMGAPDFIDLDGSDEPDVTAPAPPQPMVVVQKPEPMVLVPKPEPIAAPVTPSAIQPLLKPSLGSTLLANGIVRRPNAPASDALAPIRRMSQAEKIAFFS
jgi:hypothetical protein